MTGYSTPVALTVVAVWLVAVLVLVLAAAGVIR